jgi:hypothetical protein
MIREGEPIPEIYTDEAFSKTNHWYLSTSQLSSNFFDGWGYGEGTPVSIYHYVQVRLFFLDFQWFPTVMD